MKVGQERTRVPRLRRRGAIKCIHQQTAFRVGEETRPSGWLKHVRAYDGWLGMMEPMKDVAACDKSRGGGKQPLIRESPNEETQSAEGRLPAPEYIGRMEGTWGSETSQYPKEKKQTNADNMSWMVFRDHFGTCGLHDSVSSGERKRNSLNYSCQPRYRVGRKFDRGSR